MGLRAKRRTRPPFLGSNGPHTGLTILVSGHCFRMCSTMKRCCGSQLLINRILSGMGLCAPAVALIKAPRCRQHANHAFAERAAPRNNQMADIAPFTQE